MAVAPTYLEDASGYHGSAERLLTPQSTAEVADALLQAAEAGVEVTVYGAGTGLTGGAVAEGGWILSTEKLRRLEVGSGRATAGAGVSLKDLHAAAAAAGQFYPPDPTEWSASVGGTIATNASGARSFRYGATRRWVQALEVVLANGRTMRVARGEPVDFDVPAVPIPRTSKNTAGFPLSPGMDWVDLFIGSEGILGVVTETELGLLPRPKALITGVVFLPGDEQVIKAVDAWRDVPGLRMLEYFDGASLDLLREAYPDIPVSAFGALNFEQESEVSQEAEIEAWLDRLEAAGADLDGSWFASSDRDRERFRVFRHAVPESVNDRVRRQGFQKLGSDYAVPIENNGEMLRHYRTRLDAEFPGRYVIFGHIGDAHVHVNILPASTGDYERGRALMLDFARKAVSLGGTVSAEHGLGKRKKDLLRLQYSEAELAAMRAVKEKLDPAWRLGRGNLLAPPATF